MQDEPPSREERLRQMADETPAFLWITTADGTGVFINKPLAEFVGTTQNQKLHEGLRAYVHPEDVERIAKKYYDSVAARSAFTDEQRLRRFDGEYRWFISRGQPRFSSDGTFLGFAGSLCDVTERKAAEDRERASAELVRGQNRVLELIAQNAPLPKALDLLVRVIEDLSPDMLGSILLLDPDGIHVRHGAAPNLPEAYIRAIDGEPIGPVAGSCGTAAYRGEPVIVEDIATDPLWENYREFALSHGLRACWSTPIFENKGPGGQKVLGTFALYFRASRRPDARHRELIEMATQTAAIAIVKSRETEALRKSEERLRLAIAHGKLSVWEWRIDTDYLILSEALPAMFEYRKEGEELTLNKSLEIVHPDDRERVEAAIRTALAKHTDYGIEYRIRLRDGSVRWMAAYGRAQYGPAEEPVRMLGVARDITQLRQAEEEVRRRDAQLIQAQHIAHLGSFEWDIEANRVYRSAELCNVFGLSPEEFEPTIEGYLKRLHPEDRDATRELIERAFRQAGSFDHEERIIRPDGSVRTLRSQGRFLCDAEGRPQKLVGICQDITDRKRAEQQLYEANAALAQELKERARTEKEIQALTARLMNAQEEERSRLARELHDDLSQQIAALSVAVSNLRMGVPPEFTDVRSQSERIREKLVNLGEGIRRMSHELHPAVLQYSGMDSALRAYCSEFAALAGIQVTFRAEGSFTDVSPAVALCAYRITQEALQNVVKHARTDRADVAVTRLDGAVQLRISDNGIGMDLNAPSASGGLGLTSIRERARLVNGKIDIQSEPGRGTTLILTVPVQPEGAKALQPSATLSGLGSVS